MKRESNMNDMKKISMGERFLRLLDKWLFGAAFIPRATMAHTLANEIGMINTTKDEVSILGDSLKFVDEAYKPIFLNFIEKITAPQHVRLTYFLRTASQKALIQEISETCKKNNSTLEVREILFEDAAQKYEEESKTQHFMLIRNRRIQKCQLWIEGYHDENNQYAEGCEYVYSAEDDIRLPLIDRRIYAFKRDSRIISLEK